MSADVEYLCTFSVKPRKIGEPPILAGSNEQPPHTVTVKVDIKSDVLAAPISETVRIGDMTAAREGRIVAAAVAYGIAGLLTDAAEGGIGLNKVNDPTLAISQAGGVLRFTIEIGPSLTVRAQVKEVTDLKAINRHAEAAFRDSAAEIRAAVQGYWIAEDASFIHDLFDKVHRGPIWIQDSKRLVQRGLQDIISGA
ncbi:hypothetical protein FFK22_008890 [Mycobacterium sp. KBS0706]|uniref:hypothetical protein n=1 Tax=Mycobacterium sp. KBS0706 TaxID=2578109 RepID=UPI00110FDABE|nr:hypothetical protein [Mycobacterium sp. KBS0706]TSD89087.1 hypothetical protein FFK22_008890 [Mycobacterium sp. KBS0706]